MRTLKVLLCCCPIIFALAVPAIAHEAQSGETCGDVKRNIAHKIQDKNYSCDSTTCSKCSTGSNTISGCTSTTYYENCTAALAGGGGNTVGPTTGGGVKQTPTPPARSNTPSAR